MSSYYSLQLTEGFKRGLQQQMSGPDYAKGSDSLQVKHCRQDKTANRDLGSWPEATYVL